MNNKELNKLAQSVFDQYDNSEKLFDESIALNSIEKDLKDDFEELNELQTQKSRHDFFKIDGAKESDYQESIHYINDEDFFVFGIRHMSGNKDLPFINIIPSFNVKTKNEVLELYDLVKDRMDVFNPLHICIKSTEKLNGDFIGSVHMVAFSEKIKNIEPWEMEKRLSLRDLKNDEYYQWYKDGYREFHKDYPELTSKVTVNSLDVLNESNDEGLLKLVELDGQRIGLVAAEKSDLLGHSGMYFNEIFISKEYKGQGIAKAIQRKFIANFSEGMDFVWGTIDANNLPSYKTAASNGRKPIHYECFYKIGN